ncbi:PleD family two-component system response regulator [Candidatus Cyanaurora vandensis]|uniref:response regulator n=1 Tax=Candidatus Cyanaurora vandensis TaxID=2714958 RepID=UPI00257EF86E|nr:response regulator [Candidatus Cyanaurora vandensis]
MQKKLIVDQILFVDDDPAQCFLIKHCLSKDYQVTTAANVAEALVILQQLRPALVITDIVMPQASGFELAKAIQASDHAGQFPIVFISGENSLANRINSYRSGGEYFMSKPWSREELLAMVASSLRRSRNSRPLAMA